MDVVLLVILILADIVLLGFIYVLSKKKAESPAVLQEIVEERKIINELRASLKDQVGTAQSEIKKQMDKMTVLVTEAEMEHKSTRELVNGETHSLLDGIEDRLNEPVALIKKKCDSVQRAIDKLKMERESLLLAIKKAETLTKFFNKNISYEDILEEIEDKKYVDARHMLSKGFDPTTIASQLNMPESEVELLASFG